MTQKGLKQCSLVLITYIYTYDQLCYLIFKYIKYDILASFKNLLKNSTNMAQQCWKVF
jgi:hypothetical protein